MRKLIIALLVVAVLAVVGDRLAARLAAEQAEDDLATRGVTSPEVTIHGFPFLTQALRRDFRHVTVTAPSVSRSGVVADDVQVDLRDVRVTSSSSGTAGQATGSGVVPWGELESVADFPVNLSAGPRGAVQLAAQVDVLGQAVRVLADATIELRSGQILVRPTQISIDGGGALPGVVSQQIAEQLALRYPVPGLPAGVRLTGITAERDGLRIAVAARNVSVS